MKTLKSTLLFIAFLTFTSAYGQKNDSTKVGVEFGLHHSFNFTHLNGTGGPIIYSNRVENYELLRNRLTFDLGMFAIVHLSNHIALQAEAVYTYMGAHFQKNTTYLHDLGSIETAENESIAADYFKLALANNIKFNDRIFFQIGGYGSSLLSAEKFSPWWEIDHDKKRSQLTGVRKFDAGVLGGFGLSTRILNITFRYNYGLLDVFEKGELEELNMKNGVFQFLLQWKLYSDYK